jgi:predicted nucleic acid-binding protein/predicted transcriptional regulator
LTINIINKTTSKEFNDAVELGDRNSKTLGFLPKVAFEKYAKQSQLIGAFDKSSNELLGYLLFRVSYNRVTIVHLCINETKRNNSSANKLVNYLKKNTKQYDGIRLSCRNNYGIDSVWEKFNFVPIKEKIGRSKEGYPLTIWWFPHYQNNLLSQISEYELNNKIVAVIDMNIFLDIKGEREEESLALKSDWLLSEAILYFTREIYIEINNAKTPEIKKSSRNLLSYFEELPFKDEEEFFKILQELKNEFPLKQHKNDKSDLNHIAYSISGGAQFFITRDEEILKNNKFFKKYNLTVYRPSEFITHLDENIQVSKYKPQSLIGTSINSKRVTTKNIDFFTETFLKSNEKKSHFQKIIRNSLSLPNKFELITISKKSHLLAFMIFDRTSENKLKIPVFRFLNSSLRITLTKHLLFKSILTSISENRTFVEINENHLEDDIKNAIQEARFTKLNNTWQKINIKDVLDTKNLYSRIDQEENTKNIITNINSNLEKTENVTEFIKKYNYERFLSPLKIKDLEIPSYIVPIKPHWAEQLFNDKSKEKLDLFEPEYELLLNRENVYYRSASPKIINAPARILWYSSENKSTKVKGSIIATSYVDEIFIDKPKKLFKQFEKLGIYKWKDISETAGKKDKIMAFVFSDTELLKKPISLKNISNSFNVLENKKFMVVAPIKIKTETYLALYKQGMDL